MMDADPCVSRLCIYPIKSLDSVTVEKVDILKSGALKYDRQFAIFDQSNQFVNGKRNQSIHALRSEFDLETNCVSLWVHDPEQMHRFELDRERKALEAWLSDYFDVPVTLQQNLETGFPDDTASPGPTIVSTATLETVASWYSDLDVEDVRSRFRANIELAGVPPFWEDQLFTTAKETVPFQIGEVQFIGINPCQRCIVVTRDPKTGTAYPNFQKTFVARRKATLPSWSARSRFNHFYRLAVNTRLPNPEGGQTICMGDQLKIHASHP